MTKNASTSHAPEGWQTVTPRIFVDDPKLLVDFVREVFEARGDYHDSRPSEIWIGDSVIMISGTEARPATAACLYVYVADVDATYERAIAAGAKALEAPAVQPYGDRRAMVEDPWGNLWQIATRLTR